MLTILVLACLPVTDRAEILPVVGGKAVYPASDDLKIHHLDGTWRLERESEGVTMQQVPAIAWQHGAGTYALELFVEHAAGPFELYTTNAGTSYELLVNAERAGASGVYGESAELAKPSAATRVHPITLADGWNTIEFRVSNFVHPRAGLWEHVKIARYPAITTWHDRRIAWDLIIFGLLLMFVLMHLALGRYAKRRSYYLGFAFGALAAAFGGILRNQFAWFAIFPDLPYLTVKKVQVIALFLAGGWFAGAFADHFRSTLAKRMVIWFRRFCMVLSLVSMLAPYAVTYPLAILFFPLMIVFMTMMLHHRVSLLGCEEGLWRASATLLGDSALTYGMIHDFLNIMRATYEIQMIPYMVFIYVGIHSVVLCGEFIRSMRYNEEAKHHIMTAWEQARRDLASDLHDGVIQLTHGLEYLAEGALVCGRDDERPLRLIKETASQISEELRRTIDDLNPARIGRKGLLHAVHQLADQVRKTYGIKVRLEMEVPEHELSLSRKNHIYYIISESVSNAIRHAQTAAIEIFIDVAQDDIMLRIRNDGVCSKMLPHALPGHGLDIIRYRAEAMGGSCRAGVIGDRHFLVEVRMKKDQDDDNGCVG